MMQAQPEQAQPVPPQQQQALQPPPDAAAAAAAAPGHDHPFVFPPGAAAAEAMAGAGAGASNNSATTTTTTTHMINDEWLFLVTHLMSGQELQWALDIKQAVQDDPDLNELSDYDYSVYALVTKGDLENALYRIQGLQHFREEYKIHDTVEEGMELIKAFCKQQPWVILDLAYFPISVVRNVQTAEEEVGPTANQTLMDGYFILVMDYAAWNPKALKTEEDWRIFLGGMYYICKAARSDLHSVRKGLISLVETLGMSWKNFSVDMFSRAWYHMYDYLPQQYQHIYWVHSSVMANITHSLLKTLSKELGRKVQLGRSLGECHSRLDTLYKVPSADQAQDKLLQTFEKYLHVGESNQGSFSLPNPAEM